MKAANRRDVEGMDSLGDSWIDRDRSALVEGLAGCAYRQAELRSRLYSHFGYLWRDADLWKQDPGTVPTARNWFSNVIAPEKSPYLYHYDLR
jgi:hypothetical protein